MILTPMDEWGWEGVLANQEEDGVRTSHVGSGHRRGRKTQYMTPFPAKSRSFSTIPESYPAQNDPR